MTKGTPLMLLGPTAVGLVGGAGFILAAGLIFLMPGAFALPKGERTLPSAKLDNLGEAN